MLSELEKRGRVCSAKGGARENATQMSARGTTSEQKGHAKSEVDDAKMNDRITNTAFFPYLQTKSQVKYPICAY